MAAATRFRTTIPMEEIATPASRSTRRRRHRAALLAGVVAASGLAAIAPSSPAGAEVLAPRPYLVSFDANNGALGGGSDPAINGNGRFIAFSTQTKLVPEDTNDRIDVYVRDRWASETELVSVGDAEQLSDATSVQPSLSDDGRYVAFRSASSTWGGPASNGRWNVWVRDRVKGTTVRASIGSANDTIAADANYPTISGNGRYVGYSSKAANIVADDTNGAEDVFLRDLVAKTTERVSISVFEGQSALDSWAPSISDDGRYVSFTSKEELAGGQADDASDVFVRDRTGGSTINAHLAPGAAVANGDAGVSEISGTGRYVAFLSKATNLAGTDANGSYDVFRRDLTANATVRVSVAGDESVLANQSFSPGISDDGDRVVFSTAANANGSTDAGTDMDVYLRTISGGTTTRLSTSANASDPVGTHDYGAVSDDGAHVAFTSFVPSGPTLVAQQPVNTQQVYVWEGLSLGPLATPSAFVTQQYHDVLGRAPSSGELSGLANRVAAGASHPATVVSQLVQLDEFAAKRAPVVRLYWAFFLRKPDPSGLQYWISKYQGGASLASIAQKFAQSSEFKTRYGTLSNSAYVKQVYLNVFERQPDAGGLAFWTGKLDRKEISRGQVLVNFSESSEGKRRLAPQVHLLLTSLAMLRTVPTDASFTQGMAAYAAGEDEAAWAAQQVIVSAAYDARL